MNFNNNRLSYIKTSHSNSDLNVYYLSKNLYNVKYGFLEVGKTYILVGDHTKAKLKTGWTPTVLDSEYRKATLIKEINMPSQSREYTWKYADDDDIIKFNVPIYKISGGFDSEALEYKYDIGDEMTSLFFIRDIKAKKRAFELYINDIGHISSTR